MSDKEFEPISKILEKFSQEGHENTITFEDQKLIHKIRVYIKTDKKNFEYFCKKLKEIYTQDEFPVNSIIPSLINDFTRFTKKEEKDEIIEWFREFLWELLINNNEYLKIFGLIIVRYNRIFILGNKVKFYRKIIGLWDSDDEDLKSIAIWSLIPYIPFDYNYFLDLFEKLYEFIINSENELLITKSLEFLGNLNLDAMSGGEKTPLDLTKAENIMEKIQNVKNPYIKTEFVDGFSNLILEFNQYIPKWINLLIKVYEVTENINLKSRIMRSFSSIANKKDFTMKDSKKIEVFFKTRLEILLDQNFELPEDSIVVRPNILQDTLANIQQLSFFLPLVAENLLPLYLQVFHKYIPELVDNRPGFKGMAWQWLHGFYINMINYYKSENNYEKLTLHFKQAAEFAFSEKEKLDLLIIYNVLNNFAKLHNDLISSDGNLNFLKNFINPLWNFLKSSKKVLCVTSFRIFFQNHSIGFKSGEYGGKNINSSSSLWASKNGFNSLERWARALSNIKSIFPASGYRVRIPSKKCWNCSAFNVS